MQPYHQALKAGTILRGGSYTYRIESVLGQGSFGITYLATTRVKVQGALGELETDMQIAVKEFFLKEMNSREAAGVVTETSQGSLVNKYGLKFLKEAENLSRLHHPNIVRVLEVFSTNHTHYYAMEYVKGSSLDDYIKEWKGLPEKEAIESIRSIGNALSYMHSCKMLHLDLKPKNIMRRDDGYLYLIDFGLSKQYDTKGEPESSTTIGLGTPGYAPLEQGNIQNSKDFAATLDVYALGATFYKILTGQTPPDASVVMNEGFPDEELRTRKISEQTIGAIRQAMSPMKKVRPQSVEAFLKSFNGARTTPNDEETLFVNEQWKEKQKKREDSNEPSAGQLIDLGLSVKWASYNVGASSPEGYGDLYGWADSTGKKMSINNNDYPSSNPPESISGAQYDIARTKWGGSWRLPKHKEMVELNNRCDWKWLTYKGVTGYLVTGPNKNRIFLPAAGWRYGGGDVSNRASSGYYWSGTLKSSSDAYSFSFYRVGRSPSFSSYRYLGLSVRPVSD